MKRILLLLVLLFTLAALSVPALADQPEVEPVLTKQDWIIQQTRNSYTQSLYSAGKSTFAGFCGLMTSHQLYHMGINETLVVKDGNKQFDYYSTLGKTDAGYYIAAYPAAEYQLEEALNLVSRNGTRDVYNMIVGFQWTNTEAGAIYGHACVINAILDGTVYFVESFHTSLGGAEGNVIQCSIAEFAWLFEDWTTYEGLIHFGDYSVVCQEYESDVYLRARFDTTLRSQPGVVDRDGCTRLRSIRGGELLRATALVQTPDGQMFYRIDDGERTGYVAATAMLTAQLNGQALTLTGLSVPRELEEGQDGQVAGTVCSEYATVGAVEVCITDTKGAIALRERMETEGRNVSLEQLNEPLAFDLLEPGLYRLEVYADAASVVAQAGRPQTRYERVLLADGELQVGQAKKNTSLPEPEKQIPNGWTRTDGKWYCFRMGKAATGWLSYWGVDYFMDDTGAAVTGWQDVDGWRRYFTPTGAMCTGWLTADEGTYYLLEDGTAAMGWQEISGKKYYFADTGLLLTQGEMADGETVYVIAPDGTATEKSTEQDKSTE